MRHGKSSVNFLLVVSGVRAVRTCTCAVVQVYHLFRFSPSTKYTCLNDNSACIRLICLQAYTASVLVGDFSELSIGGKKPNKEVTCSNYVLLLKITQTNKTPYQNRKKAPLLLL